MKAKILIYLVGILPAYLCYFLPTFADVVGWFFVCLLIGSLITISTLHDEELKTPDHKHKQYVDIIQTIWIVFLISFCLLFAIKY